MSKVLRMYAVPVGMVPGEAEITRAVVLLPAGVLPEIVQGHDAEPLATAARLLEWFRANLREANGFLVASAALPALALEPAYWREAVAAVTQFAAGYDQIAGPIFVPPLEATRDAKFVVADFYTTLLNGNNVLPTVSFTPVVAPAPLAEGEQAMPEVAAGGDGVAAACE